MSSTLDEINLKDYTLDSFTAVKLAAPTLEVVFLNEDQKTQSEADTHGQLKCNNLTYPFAKENFRPCPLTIKHATVLVEADAATRVKEVLEIVLDATPLSALDYSPGDTIAILPHNIEKEVYFLLEAIELLDKANQLCHVQTHTSNAKKSLKLPPHIPLQTTPRELLRDVLNIRAVPKKQFLRSLANCCTAKEEQDFLNSLASKEGSNYYNELFLQKGFTLLDILSLCGTCKPTLSLLIEHLPRLLPRPYSIANSPITNDEHELKIIFSILNDRPGITTSMLASMANAVMKRNAIKPPTVLMYPRQTNNFSYTNDDFTNNQILVAVGTGLAPFLGFLEHKVHLLSKSTCEPGSTWLFVGAPVEAAIPHRTELLELIEKHEHQVLERYFESFSRVPDATFHYIQEQFLAHAQELVEFLLKTDTKLYVCADGSTISQTIESGLCLCLQQVLDITAEESMKMLKQFRSNGKYCEDLWT